VARAAACLLAAAVLAGSAALPATARLVIEIDKSSQSMTVALDGETLHRWPVSTGLRAHDTPSGSYTPFRMEEDHFSREWDDAPMPHSIFFTRRGHAIHGTTHVRQIGRPASHGCVRLEPENARVLFGLVRRVGLPNTRVVLHGEVPASSPPMARRALPPQDYGERPGYVDPRGGRDPRYSDPRYNDPRYGDPRYGDPRQVDPRPGYPRPEYARPDYPRQEARQGYWLRRPDGSLVFVDREREFGPPQERPFYRGNSRWG
jgi:hypothetical protein